jgi:hypothetical protein
MVASTPTTILLLSLDKESHFGKIYGSFVRKLEDQAYVKHVTTHEQATPAILGNPTAIIVTDPTLANKANKFTKVTLDVLKWYTKNGGRLIFACLFSSFVNRQNMASFWKENFGKNWAAGSYHRTVNFVNYQLEKSMKLTRQLPAQYSQKAVNLQNVAQDEALYSPNDQSETQSDASSSRPVGPSEAPTVWAKHHEGWLGFIGDVNHEQGSQAVIIAMCGL